MSKIIKQKEYTNENMQLYYFAAILGGNKEGYKDINNMLYGAKEENLAEITKQILEKYKIDVNTYYNTPEEMIFGQGMVDAGAAVKGLGAINVRCLSKDNISEAYTVTGNTEKQALYTVNTMGYDSVWSNDIKEIRAGYIAKNPLTGKDDALDQKDLEGLEDLKKRYEYYYENFS